MVKAKVNPSDVREKLTGAVLFSGRSLGKKVLILQSSPVVLQVGRLGMYMIIYCEIYIEDIYILSEKVGLKMLFSLFCSPVKAPARKSSFFKAGTQFWRKSLNTN